MSTKVSNGSREPETQPGSDEEVGPAEAGSGSPEEDASREGEIEIEVEAPGAPEDPVVALERQVAELEDKNRDTYDRLLRATADLENYRKRSRRELDDARIDARSRVLREMLPVIDNLERALAHAQRADGDSAGILEGVSLVLRQFSQALERCGVQAVEAGDKPFDPNLHEAVSQVESAEHPPGTVVQVLQTGYLIGDRLLRPSLVVVSKAPADAVEEAGAGNGLDPDAPGGAGEGRESD